MFSREQLDQVRSAVDIVGIVKEYVPSLKLTGRSARGLCPFHSERTPSFHVLPEKGIFKCFGCGEGGDVFSFLSKIENIPFGEAVERLGAQAGIVLRPVKDVEFQEKDNLRDQILRVLEAAAQMYEEQLWGSRIGEAALSYLRERSITDETARAFRLGVAPNQGTPVFEVLLKKGFTIEVCQKSGLVTKSSEGRFYDPLYGRLIFPIFDPTSRVVGFGGRLLPVAKRKTLGLSEDETKDQGPKYINSPETPVFSKGKLLYGLFQAKGAILSSRRAMVLEGYMDVVGVHQGGIPLGVATLGTALTRDHAKLLKRYADEVVAFFDPDEAGRKAAMRGLEPLLQEELFPRVVMESSTLDPDELILEKGKEYVLGLIKDAPDFVDYILKTSSSDRMGPREKSDLAALLASVIAYSPNEVLKSEWTKRVGFQLGIKPELLDEMVKKGGRAPEASLVNARVDKKPKRHLPSAEEEFLQLCLNVPGLPLEADLGPEDFGDERCRRLFELVQQRTHENGAVTVASLLNEVPDSDKEWFMSLSLEEKEFLEPMERREQLVRNIRLRKDQARLADLSRSLSSSQGDPALMNEYKELLKRLKGTARPPSA